jgi:lipopolysaccharide/colanic/teichoic acid biosynthesis glycosyltransferase
LIVLTAPLLLSIGLILFLRNGKNIVFVGHRLGRDKKLFRMYKFRSLVNGAERVVGGRMLSDRDNLIAPFGKFLRDTRLDELPQLFNVLKGDMRFVGPRPVRPEVYESLCRDIQHYDERFNVKPGLVGVSQLFTPHCTPKRIRAHFDNRCARRRRRLIFDTTLVACAGEAMLRVLCRRLARKGAKLMQGSHEKRYAARERPPCAEAIFELNGSGTHRLGLIDINHEALCVEANSPLPDKSLEEFRLRIEVRRRDGKRRIKTARCSGAVQQIRNTTSGSIAHVIKYRPMSAGGQYIVDQYFLRRSLAQPFRNLAAAARDAPLEVESGSIDTAPTSAQSQEGSVSSSRGALA